MLAVSAAGEGDRAGALWRATGALEQRFGSRLRPETNARYAAFFGRFAGKGEDMFSNESLLENAVAYALRETPAS